MDFGGEFQLTTPWGFMKYRNVIQHGQCKEGQALFSISKEEMNSIQEYLDEEFPSPKKEIVEIGNIFAMLEDLEDTIKIRRLVVDLDDLILQNR
jgi:hypothetical protein